MRVIKFRALRKEYKSLHHQSKWKYGNLLNECSIGEMGEGMESYEYTEVKPNTVGQYTGLKDKNGVEIYEGDILRLLTQSAYEVKFENGAFVYIIDDGKEWSEPHSLGLNHHFKWTDNQSLKAEVIGNIHQNKDLLNK